VVFLPWYMHLFDPVIARCNVGSPGSSPVHVRPLVSEGPGFLTRGGSGSGGAHPKIPQPPPTPPQTNTPPPKKQAIGFFGFVSLLSYPPLLSLLLLFRPQKHDVPACFCFCFSVFFLAGIPLRDRTNWPGRLSTLPPTLQTSPFWTADCDFFFC